MSEVFNKKEGWEEIPDPDLEDYWCPVHKGDHNQGIYIEKELDVGVNYATVYTFKNENGLFKVFGTVGLIQKMDRIKIGEEVGLIYKGEKPMKPPKKPFKVWKVFNRKIGKKENTPDESKPTKNPLADVEAVKIIDQLVDDLMDKHVDPTMEEILKLAKNYHIQDKETLPTTMLPRIEAELKRRG